MSDERPRQRHQAAADPADIHEEAGQDEEGDGQHRKRIHPGDDLLRNDDEWEVRHDDRDNRRDGERKADGHGGQHQHPEDDDEEAAHQDGSPAGRASVDARASAPPPPCPASMWITISAPDTGAAA